MSEWRYRALLLAFAELPAELLIRGHQVKAVPRSATPEGQAIYTIDIAIDAKDVNEALFVGVDLADEAADRIAFLSYAPCSKVTISATRFRLGIGEICELAIPHGMLRRSRAVLTKERFESMDCVSAGSMESAALRSFRTGASAENPYQSFTDLWKALERCAEIDAKAKGYTYSATCRSCGAKEDRLATQPAIVDCVRDLGGSLEAPGEAKKIADAARGLRGSLVHGGRLADTALRRETAQRIGAIQSAAAAALARQIGVRTQSRECIHLDIPVTILTIKRTGERDREFVIEGPSNGVKAVFEGAVQISRLPDTSTDATGISVMFGLAFPVPIDDLAWPELG